MKTAAPIVLAAVVAGLVGGWLSAFFFADTAPESPAVGDSARAERIERQLEGLVEETSRLSARLRDLELRGPVTAAAPEPEPLEPGAPHLQVDDETLAKLTAALEGAEGADDEELEGRVAAALTRIREAEDAERDQRRAEARAQAIEDYVEQLTEQLSLDAYQAGRMSEVLTNQSDKRNEIFADARENGTWSDMRQKMETLRTETRTSLETFLTPTQLEAYDAMPPARGFGGFRWGGGGDRGGSDNRGN